MGRIHSSLYMSPIIVSACMQACSLRRTGAPQYRNRPIRNTQGRPGSFILQVESRSSIRCISEYLAIPMLELLDLLKFSPACAVALQNLSQAIFILTFQNPSRNLSGGRSTRMSICLLVHTAGLLRTGVSSKTPGSTHHTSPKQKLLKDP